MILPIPESFEIWTFWRLVSNFEWSGFSYKDNYGPDYSNNKLLSLFKALDWSNNHKTLEWSNNHQTAYN